MMTMGIKIGRIIDGAYAAKVADACVNLPTANAENVASDSGLFQADSFNSDSFEAMIWRLLVSHPRVKPTRAMGNSVAGSMSPLR